MYIEFNNNEKLEELIYIIHTFIFQSSSHNNRSIDGESFFALNI